MADSFKDHYSEHHRSLLAQVRRRVRGNEDAEDIVQETWAKAAIAVENGSIRNLAGYLHRVAANLSIDHLRRAKARAHLRIEPPGGAIEDVACPAPIADQAIIAAQAEAAFDAAISRLPARARQVLLLNRVEGWTYARIASHLGISERTVSNDLAVAIESCIHFVSRHDG